MRAGFRVRPVYLLTCFLVEETNDLLLILRFNWGITLGAINLVTRYWNHKLWVGFGPRPPFKTLFQTNWLINQGRRNRIFFDVL